MFWTPSLFKKTHGSTLRIVIKDIKRKIEFANTLRLDMPESNILEVEETHDTSIENIRAKLILASETFDENSERTSLEILTFFVRSSIQYVQSIFTKIDPHTIELSDFSQLEKIMGFLLKHLEPTAYSTIANQYNNFINTYINHYLNPIEFNNEENSDYFIAYETLMCFYLGINPNHSNHVLDIIANDNTYPFFIIEDEEYKIKDSQNVRDLDYENFGSRYQTLIDALKDVIFSKPTSEPPSLFTRFSYQLALKLIDFMINRARILKNWGNESHHLGLKLLSDICSINDMIFDLGNSFQPDDCNLLNPETISEFTIKNYYFPDCLKQESQLINQEITEMQKNYNHITSLDPESEKKVNQPT